jgi:hypothetical protein
VEKDGGKILGHVFGKRQKNIQNALSKQSGVSNNSVTKVLKIAAPVVLAFWENKNEIHRLMTPKTYQK